MWRAGATLRCGARASHCGGFSCCGAQALGAWASAVVARGLSSCGSRALECRLSSCGTWASLLRSMWDLPGPGLKPVSPALAGGLLTTAPPGKSSAGILVDCRQESSCYRQFVPDSLQLNLERIISVAFLGNFPMEFPPTDWTATVAFRFKRSKKC